MKEFIDSTTQNESSLQLLSLQHTEESKRIEEVDDRENFLALYNAYMGLLCIFSTEGLSVRPGGLRGSKVGDRGGGAHRFIGTMGFHVYWSQKEERDVNYFLTC